ncbi:transglycosylase domain-containing protein [Dysosmobacter sp.]|uniref:transglycosylase domain-containing protein n=1 Tax=Dysosmobacter sp. TaxID=2591382 RepID=UPI002A8FCF09|nr:transglycosylase domain-containing protein [Dysosmobacter sp.]MDY3984640.1 transglycosylase domain-containing protein [Dysosmobacter sp.]
MEHGRREPAREPAARRETKRRRSGGSAAGKIFGVLGTLALIGICTAVMFAMIFMKYVDTNVKPNVEVRAEDYTMQLSSIIYCQDKETGEWVEYQTIHGEQNRILVDFDQMPDALWQAAVAIEDHRFFEHHGVDWRRTAGAAVNMFIGMKNTFGGSTITQQMLKNMTEDNDGTVNRKVREIFRALEFEKNYTKQQILELYLNTIAFGKGCYGVQTAAEFYFGKDVSELSVAESACLIAITNNPSMYGPMSTVVFTRKDGTKVTARELNKERQETILLRMAGGNEEVGYTGLSYLTMEEAEAACKEELHFTDGSTSADDIVNEATGGIKINSWFVDQVILDVSNDLAEELKISVKEARLKLYNGGYNIYTTLDPEIQEIAESVYEDRSNLDVTSRSGQKLQSGITIIDPETGNIVAMVGKVGEKTENLGWNYATGRRQVGSSVKPLTVYAPALDSGAITMASTFDNYPVRLLNDKPWPKNSPQGYSGWTTLSTGVAKSINTVAVQVVEKLGLPESFAFATEKLNLGLVAEDMNTSSLGLGGLTYGLNTEEMAAAYACFANGGVYNEPRTYVKVLANDNKTVILENTGESHVAMKETTAYFMNTLLQGVVNGGTGGSAKFSSSIAIAGKTGTTSENYDRYFVGYTPYYVAAVWTGYDQNEKISYSGNPAITMWKKVMSQIHEDLPAKSFSKPTSGLERVEVCSDSGMLPTDACRADIRGDSHVRTVEVLAGTAPTEPCTLHKVVDYCVDGHCLATENCPAESVVQKGALDYVREDYGENIKADDDPYLIMNLEKALEPQEPTPENPSGSPGGCPAHTTALPPASTDPDDPNYDPTQDPGDPNYQPPAEGGQPSGGGEQGGGNEPSVPTEPQEPEEPTPPDTGDWFSGFWTT